MKKFLIILTIIILVPIIMSALLNISVFSFALGSTDSWITFWGSYMGALIGAGIVYLVTTMQIKEQRSIQIEAIREEHKNALNREMKQYHFRNQIDKIEEFYDVLDELTAAITKCTNEFTMYITLSDILFGGRDEYSEEKEIEYKNEIKINRQNFYDRIHKLTILDFKIKRLTHYIEGTDSYGEEISSYLTDFINELKKGYNDKNSFKVLIGDYNKPVQINSRDHLISTISYLLSAVLDEKLNEKINEMRSDT